MSASEITKKNKTKNSNALYLFVYLLSNSYTQ